MGVVGRGSGQGFNMNVAWNVAWKDQRGMGDDEYFAAWEQVLLPVVREFKPELVLVSAGFDAAHGDVGGCSVSPIGFARLTRLLQNACPKLVLVLEGGYKLDVISKCVSGCLSALLGDRIAFCTHAQPKKEARLSIERTLRAHRPFWTSLSKDARLDILSPQVILMTNQRSALQCEESAISFDCGLHDKDQMTDLSPTAGRRNRCHKAKPVTGISVATRNAATNNWKNDVKKLLRKQSELTATVEKINALKGYGNSRRMSAKDRAVLEEEDEVRWQLEEIIAELGELNSLSRDDVLRMYSGCR